MDKKLTKLIGLKKTEFDAYVECGEISLIKEFRKPTLSAVKIQNGGTNISGVCSGFHILMENYCLKVISDNDF
ncbi:MAG: hypothetical protein OCC49_16210 [Fibrobacterales bacterium]